MNMFMAGILLMCAWVNISIRNWWLAAGCFAACALNVVVHYYA